MARLRINLDEEGRPSAGVLVLSRRNLLALLHKLEMRGSARTLLCGDVKIGSEYADDFPFTIQGEDDLAHYAGRPDPPGQMHPLTEEFIREQG